MASRLNALEAATLTNKRTLELEDQAKRLKAETRLKAIELARHTRLWNIQSNLVIESALNQKTYCIIESALVGANKLIENGFTINYVNKSTFLIDQKQAELKEEEKRRSRLFEAESFKFIMNGEIREFIRQVRMNERFNGMTITKENVVKRLLEKIEAYREAIEFERSDRDRLFDYLFDSELFLFKPIESLRPKTQTLQNSLHKYETLIKNLPQEEKSEEFSDEDDLEISDICDDKYYISAVKSKIPEKYWVNIDPKNSSNSINIKNKGDFFYISWDLEEIPEEWLFEEIMSAKAMAWLAGEYGQDFMSAIESEIKRKISIATSNFSLMFERYDNEDYWCCNLGETRSIESPSPEQVSKILKIMKYEVKYRSSDSRNATLDISW